MAGRRGSSQSIQEGMDHLLAGRYRSSRAIYTRLQANDPDNMRIQLEILCLLLARGPDDLSVEALGGIEGEDLDPTLRARLLTAKAYLAAHRGESHLVEDQLKEACVLDPSFPLSHLSLGRYLLFAHRDQGLARKYLENAVRLAPGSEGALLGLVSLEAESGNIARAQAAAFNVVRKHPLSLRGWLSFMSSSLFNSPLWGRLPALILLAMAFLPWIAPVMAAIWLAYSAITLWALRRTSPVLALYPLIPYAVFLAGYALRWILFGRLWP